MFQRTCAVEPVSRTFLAQHIQLAVSGHAQLRAQRIDMSMNRPALLLRANACVARSRPSTVVSS